MNLRPFELVSLRLVLSEVVVDTRRFATLQEANNDVAKADAGRIGRDAATNADEKGQRILGNVLKSGPVSRAALKFPVRPPPHKVAMTTAWP